MNAGSKLQIKFRLKLLINVFLIFIIANISIAQTIANKQNLFDQYIQVAMTDSLSDYTGTDGISCNYIPGIDPIMEKNNFVANSVGKNQQQATQLLALKCIKFKCDHIQDLIKSGMNYLNQFSDSQNSDFLSSQGHTKEQIDKIIEQKKLFDEKSLSTVSCSQISSASRMLLVYSCFDAMICTK